MSVIPDSVISFLLENLTKIAKSNYDLYANAKDNAKSLLEEVEKLKGLVQDFDRYNQESEYLKTLSKQIREKLEEAGKAVESYVNLVERHRERNCLVKMFELGKGVRKKAVDITKTLQTIKDLNDKGIPNGIEMLKQQSDGQQGQRANYTEPRKVEEDLVIGFKEESNNVTNLITRGADNFEVIAIVGMIGIGKTTLAKKVLRDLNGDVYKIRAFANVSKECNRKEILRTILSQFKTVNNEEINLPEDLLKKHLHDQLQSRDERFVIVLDDIWYEKDIEWLKGAFPKRKGCKILITTCHNHVAESTDSKIFKLDLLQREDSQKLLTTKVFRGKKCTVKNSPEFTQIVKECDGLPLSIEGVAQALREQENLEFSEPWMTVAKNVNCHALRKETKRDINDRYLALENEVKHCFLYLGIFPDDFEIPVCKLMRLWIAEGLVKEEYGKTMEDKAKNLFGELVRNNLVIIEKKSSNGVAKTIRLHRLLLEFCRIKATEEKFFHEISHLEEDSGVLNLDPCKRLCINKVMHNLDYKSADHLHSFLVIPDAKSTSSPKFVSSISEKFKNVKVLEIQSHIPKPYSDKLSKLSLLKYMAISSDFEVFPEETANMEHLQTLEIKTSFSTLELNSARLTMPNLKHLQTNVPTKILLHSDAKNQKRGKALVGKNLQTLSKLSPESCTRDVFDQTPHLKKLVISGKLTELFKVDVPENKPSLLNIQKLEELRILKLLGDGPDTKSYTLPWKESFFLQQLTQLTLSKTSLEWGEMSKLGKLQRLEVLKLKDNAFRGSTWISSMGGFDNLKYLHIERTDLVTWVLSAGDHFPLLMTIKFKTCRRLQEIPRCLENFPHLRLVVLENTTSAAAKSARALELLMVQKVQKDKAKDVFQLDVSGSIV